MGHLTVTGNGGHAPGVILTLQVTGDPPFDCSSESPLIFRPLNSHTIFRYFLRYFPRLHRRNFSQIPQDLSLSCDPVGFAIFATRSDAEAAAVRERHFELLHGALRCIFTEA